MPPPEFDPYDAGPDQSAEIPPRRNPQRDWAAPPPWSGADGPAPAGESAVPAAPPAVPGDPWGSEARGLAGSAADRLAGPDPSDPASARGYDELEPDAGRYDVPGDDAARYARPAAAAGAAGAAAYAASESLAAAPPVEPDDEPDWGQPGEYSGADRGAYGSAARPPARGRRQAPPASRDQVRLREAQDPSELFGPAWERPRRYEAYPSLRTRVGIPAVGLGRVGGAALALVFAALILFFVGPMLLGIGGDDSKPGVAATASAETAPTPTPLPTEPPAPTPQVYVVAKGDTMSKIAKKYGVTIEQLLAANPKIKNPNKIAIGDQITIPVPVSDAGGLEDASAAP